MVLTAQEVQTLGQQLQADPVAYANNAVELLAAVDGSSNNVRGLSRNDQCRAAPCPACQRRSDAGCLSCALHGRLSAEQRFRL